MVASEALVFLQRFGLSGCPEIAIQRVFSSFDGCPDPPTALLPAPEMCRR